MVAAKAVIGLGSYWDEPTDKSYVAALNTYNADMAQTGNIRLFGGGPFFNNGVPFSAAYTEAGSGQYFVSSNDAKRASFADATARHKMEYSRFHKSKFFCASCHDVSNPVLANLTWSGTGPLPSELQPSFAYFHVERTFSEFMLSAYGADGGAPALAHLRRRFSTPPRQTTTSPAARTATCGMASAAALTNGTPCCDRRTA
jgi:hypothetical protein